jgi:ABC-type branched-subunit amino acid transport system substrate-binding protein
LKAQDVLLVAPQVEEDVLLVEELLSTQLGERVLQTPQLGLGRTPRLGSPAKTVFWKI